MTDLRTVVGYDTWDCFFLLWFITDASFEHTPISMAGQMMFYTYSFFKCVNSHILKKSYLFFLYAIFAFFCWLNIERGNAISVSTAKKMLIVIVRNSLFVFFIYQYLQRTNIEKLKGLFFRSCIFASAILLITNFQFTGSFVMREVEDSINGNSQAVNNAIILGWLYCTRDKSFSKLQAGLMAFLFLFCVLAGTRKAIIVLFIVVTIYTLFRNPSLIIRNVLKMALFAGIILFLLLKVDFIYDIIGNRFEGMLGFINNSGDIDASTKTRGQYIDLGIAYFLMRPFDGYGIDCFREIPGSYDTYSHNNYIELLFGIGLWGTIFYYLMYVVSFFKGAIKYTSNKHNTYVVLGLAIILACLFADYGMVSYFDRSTYLKIVMCYFMVSYQTLSQRGKK